MCSRHTARTSRRAPKDRRLYTVGAFPEGHAVNAHEIRAGVVYKDANVTVTAFATKHAMESYGYRFDTPDRSIVISGDTNPTQATIDACHGCDVLIHEVLTLEWLASGRTSRDTRRSFTRRRRSSIELATTGEAGPADPVSRVVVAASGGGFGAIDGGSAAQRDVAVSRTRRRCPRSGRLLDAGDVI